MNTHILEAESTLTDRYQTTVPKVVRDALQLRKRDTLHFRVLSNGQVLLCRDDTPAEDPALEPFLEFLAADIQARPDRLRPVTGELIGRMTDLAQGVEFDIDAPLSPEDD